MALPINGDIFITASGDGRWFNHILPGLFNLSGGNLYIGQSGFTYYFTINKGTGRFEYTLGGNYLSHILTGLHAAILAGSNNNNSGRYSVIIGGSGNRLSYPAESSVISAGDRNIVNDAFCFVGAGTDNRITGHRSAIVAGETNNINGSQRSFIGAGINNKTSGHQSSLVGGEQNQLSGLYGFIGGGLQNNCDGYITVIVGGNANLLSGDYSIIVGGDTNEVQSDYAGVIVGANNKISGNYSVIGGGDLNKIGPLADRSFIGAGQSTTIHDRFCGALAGTQHSVSGNRSAVVAGSSNTITNARSFIGAGLINAVHGGRSAIVAGSTNYNSGNDSFIAAGVNNRISGDNAHVIGSYGIVSRLHTGATVFTDSKEYEKISQGPETATFYFDSGIFVKRGILRPQDGLALPTTGIAISQNSRGEQFEIRITGTYGYVATGQNDWGEFRLFPIGQAASSQGSGVQNSFGSVIGRGTNYVLTTTYSAVDFGTTDPIVTLTGAGTYLLLANVLVDGVGANSHNCTFKLQNTTTSAHVTGSEATRFVAVVRESVSLMGVLITTQSTETVQIFGRTDEDAGTKPSVDSLGTSLIAVRLS